MRSRSVLVLSLVLFGACATAPAIDPTDARAAVLRAGDAWADAVNRGDLESLVNSYTDDGVIYAPNAEPVRGRAAIRAFTEQFAAIAPRDARLATEDFQVCGDTAWRTGTYSMSIHPPGAERFTDRGRFMEIWKRQQDGSWRIHRDIFNTSLPGAH